MKIIIVLLLTLYSSSNVYAARPITYNVTIDYNSVSNQFENARIIGGASSNIQVNNGAAPIVISTAKDSITGLTYSQAGSGNQQISLRRSYSLFDFLLSNNENGFYHLIVNNTLSQSVLDVSNGGESYFNDRYFNHGCSLVSQNTKYLQIITNGNSPCSGDTTQYNTTVFDTLISAGQTRMIYYFDVNNSIKKYLSNPATKVGKYTGSVTYNGDSVYSRVGGTFSEYYIFNFTINKLKLLTSINFPNGKISNLAIKKVGSNYQGKSQLNFNIDGVFNYSNKFNFQLTSANGVDNKLSLRNGSNNIFYNVSLTNLTTGKTELFKTNNEIQNFDIASNDNFQGLLGFDFIAPISSTPNGNYSDQLTMIVSLNI
ncbi:hypothetical protein [Photobacterium kishitanii]|uniref:hypothetical protein n=1 Tax=Photobacterium kishitanii TaxID=318456 RepID=UPI000432C92B|nr:hypothetical protein [Photobacterium kishitanii]CEO41867.1 exported hypothetical protein [Photobacterium kishitanii]